MQIEHWSFRPEVFRKTVIICQVSSQGGQAGMLAFLGRKRSVATITLRRVATKTELPSASCSK
jgi:hypothetical protein